MTEQQDVKAGAEPVSANRGITEILADPRVEPAVAPVREAILEAKEFAEEMTLTVERRRIREVCESFKRAGYTTRPSTSAAARSSMNPSVALASGAIIRSTDE